VDVSQSLLIVFREVLKAGIILGIVLAATQGICRRNELTLLES